MITRQEFPKLARLEIRLHSSVAAFMIKSSVFKDRHRFSSLQPLLLLVKLPKSPHGLLQLMPAIINRIQNDRELRQELPEDRNNNPSTKETLGKDVLLYSGKGQRSSVSAMMKTRKPHAIFSQKRR
jgi:hypothetical protein